MLRFFLIATLALIIALGPGLPAQAQIPVEDWTRRPDASAPAGIRGDALIAQRRVEALYHLDAMHYNEILFGMDQIPSILVLQDWDMVPLSMTSLRHELEIRAGVLDWLGVSLRIPAHYREVEFATSFLSGTSSVFGIGDIEVHALYALHTRWPYRAHLSGGVAFPTGGSDFLSTMPNNPDQDRLLPYPMQPGDGTYALLPGAVFVAENEFGTVGFKVDARIPVGENSRGWTRGSQVDTHIWMSYRFTDWVSGSSRITFQRSGDLKGIDPGLDPWSSPLANPNLQGGSRVLLPVGINILFADGPFRGNRLSAEFVLPVHQKLDGPQLGANVGGSVSWGVEF
jgi:hypothetical protein